MISVFHEDIDNKDNYRVICVMDIVVKKFCKLWVILYKVNGQKIRKAIIRKNSPVIFYYSNETNMKHHNENIVVLVSDEKIAEKFKSILRTRVHQGTNVYLFLLFILIISV